LLKKYTKYNTRRKPELLKPSTYSLIHYNEANRVVKEYNALAEKAEAIYQQLPPDYKDAFYQLIWYPVIACANLNELYVTAAKNQQYAQQGRAMTNAMAGKVQALFDKDSLLTLQFHTELANGKWNHMMSQTHIGYTYWNSPPHNNMPKTETIDLPSEAKMGIAVEGDERFWTTNTNEAELPTFEFYNNPTYSFEIFNRGAKAFKYKIKSKDPWIKVARSKGKIKTQEKFNVRIDWENAPIGNHESQIIIKGAGEQIPIQIKIDHHPSDQIRGFVEHNGYISIAAPNFSTAYTPDPFQWKIIDNLGRTGSSVISLPIKKGRIKLDENTPKISYDVHFKSKGKVKVHLHFSPTLNYAAHRKGMLYALSFDGENPQIIDYDTDPMIFNYNGKVPSKWEKNVGDAIKVITTEFEIKEAGNHTLHYYRIDEGLVLQHIVIETTEQKPSYFAPPESAYLGK
ncbi:MAG: glycosyl hydrolase, partial [Bacteroidota bacterium]